MATTLLDAYALIALLADERAQPQVGALVAGGGCAVSAVNLLEVVDHLVRVRGVPEDVIDASLEPLIDGPLSVLAVDRCTARRAASVRAAHYHRSERPISLADCVLLASGDDGDRIATADAHVLAVAPLVRRIAVPLGGGRPGAAARAQGAGGVSGSER